MKLFANSSGFSMIEAMVAAGLFSVAILGMVTLMERQNVALGGLQTQINLRQILNSAEQAYEANSNNFPPAAAAASGDGAASLRPIIYVGCFQGSGLATSNSISNMAFVSVDLGPGANLAATTITGACDCNPQPPVGPGGVNYLATAEVHVVRTITPPGAGVSNAVSFYVFLLPPMAAGANPCSPTPSSYGVGAPASPRNWSATNYVSTPTKLLQDSFDVTYPP